MDSYSFVDNIQIEKANAVARYKRFNNIAKLFRLLEVFVAVALISWSSTRLPTVFKVSGEYLYAFSCYILNQHIVFLLGNVIVILCYILSRNETDHVHDYSPQVLEVTNKIIEVDSNVELVLPQVEEKEEQKVLEINETVVINESENKVVDDVELVANGCNQKQKIDKTEAEDAIKQAAKQIERFQRTHSAKLKRVMSTKPSRELRRSVTERRKSVDGGGGDTPVEKLSNEEFRLAVEAFILKQQSFLKQQTMVD